MAANRHPIVLLAFLASIALSGPAMAGSAVYGTDASGDLTGSRDYPSTASTPATIAWDVQAVTEGYRYTYTLTFPNDGVKGQPPDHLKGVSHFNIDLSDGLLLDSDGLALIASSATINGDPISGSNIEFGTMDGISGVKLDIGGGGEGGSVEYAFISNRVPVWGNFAVKVARSIFYNEGFGNELASMDVNDFIVVPDSVLAGEPEPEPVPGASAIGVGLLGVAGLTLRRRRRPQT